MRRARPSIKTSLIAVSPLKEEKKTDKSEKVTQEKTNKSDKDKGKTKSIKDKLAAGEMKKQSALAAIVF